MLNNFIKNIKNLSTNSKINQNNILNVTHKAWGKINSILQQSNNNAMILNISSGGCNGFNYKLTILDRIFIQTMNIIIFYMIVKIITNYILNH